MGAITPESSGMRLRCFTHACGSFRDANSGGSRGAAGLPPPRQRSAPNWVARHIPQLEGSVSVTFQPSGKAKLERLSCQIFHRCHQCPESAIPCFDTCI